MIHLGRKIIENIAEEHIENIFLDKDYHFRTVFKIITINKLYPLLSSPKLNVLLEMIWVGKQSFKCDGRLQDFSTISHILQSKLKKLPGEDLSFNELVTAKFKSNIDNEKFWFQYSYRTKSVRYIYFKELICALFNVILYQYINFKYLIKDSDAATMQKGINDYKSVANLGIAFTCSIALHLL